MRVRQIVILASLVAEVSAAQQRPIVRLDPEFSSSLSVQQIEDAAIQMLSRPIETVTTSETGETTIKPSAPVIREIIGCRGEELPLMAAGLSAVELPWVWLVKARGTFSIVSLGTYYDTEAYLLVHPTSGFVFEWGGLPKP